MGSKKSNRTWPVKLGYAVIAVLASVILWLYVMDNEGVDSDTTVNGISVVYEGLEQISGNYALVMTDGQRNTVTIQFVGRRSVLSKLDRNSVAVVADVSHITSAGTYWVPYEIAYPDSMSQSEIDSVTIRSALPTTVKVTISKLSSKEIPVRATFTGKLAEGYAGDEITVTPETVTVSGIAEVLEEIEDAHVELGGDDIAKSISSELSYTLRDKDGNELSAVDMGVERTPEKVRVEMQVFVVKEVALEINILPGGGATADNVTYEIEPKTVMLQGSESTLAGVNQITLGTIDLSKVVTSSVTQEFQIVIPNDTENLTGEAAATVTLTIVGLSSENITTTNIQLINKPEGYDARLVTTRVTVLVRGPAQVLELIADYNVRVVGDLSDVGEASGNLRVDAQVYIDGFSEVGPVGEYKVVVEVGPEGTFDDDDS